MIGRIEKNQSQINWLIKFIWLIISAICIIGLVTSCSTSKSIRGGKRDFSKKSYIEKENTNKKEVSNQNSSDEDEEYNEVKAKEISSIKDFADKISNKTNNNQISQNSTESTGKKIPTLREQMKLLVDEQTIIKSKINSLQNDVSDIKSSIIEIKNNLKSNKSNDLIAENKKSSVILSDENDAPIEKEFKEIPKKKIEIKKVAENSNQKSKVKKVVKKNSKINITKQADKAKNQTISNNISKEVKNNDKKLSENKQIKSNQTQQPIDDNFNLALKSFQSQNYSKAIELLTKNLSTETNSNKLVDTYYWLGESYYGAKQYDKAIENLNKVLKQKSHSKQSNAQILIAECLIRKGDVAEAKRAFQSFISKYPQSDYIPRAKKMLQQL